MKIKILKSFKEYESLPYEEDTRAWHVWLDLCQLGKISKNDEITVLELAQANGMPETYYFNSFDELLADEIITIIEE